MKNCTYCKKDNPCDECDNLVNQKEELSANLNELKQDPPNEFGHIIPKYIIINNIL